MATTECECGAVASVVAAFQAVPARFMPEVLRDKKYEVSRPRGIFDRCVGGY